MLPDHRSPDPTDPVPSAFPAHAPTSQARWSAFASTLDPLQVRARSAVVLAPHPDDETLACGGLISLLLAGGAEVRVLAVTDGEASHPDVPGLAARRRREQQLALATLGLTEQPLRLGLPDGRVARDEDQLAEHLQAALEGADLLVAPWRLDGHADHDACGRAALRAGDGRRCRVLAYPVWAWQWATEADLAGERWQRLDLPADLAARKARAIGAFVSQTTTVLGAVVLEPVVLARFHRSFEVFADVA